MNSANWNEHKNPVTIAAGNLLYAAKTRGQIAPAVAEFVGVTSRLPVARLEHWERAFRHEVQLAAQPRLLFGFQLFPNRRQRPIPWLDCCSYDGYQRENALRALDEGAPNGFLLAIVLRRLNDWVPEVRAAARDRIPIIADKTDPTYILEALCGILPYLNTWERLQADDTKVLIDLLSIRDIPLQLSEKLISMTAGPAPSILGQAGRQPAIDSFLPRISAAAIQPAVRAKAYRSQLNGVTTWIEGYRQTWTDRRWCRGRSKPIINRRKIDVNRPFLEILTAAAKDSSPIVRRVAGDALFFESGSLSADLVPIAELLAKDDSPSVAERGIFALKRVDA